MYTHTHEIAVGAGVGIQTDCTAIKSISVSSADVWNLPNEEVKPFFRNIKCGWISTEYTGREGRKLFSHALWGYSSLGSRSLCLVSRADASEQFQSFSNSS